MRAGLLIWPAFVFMAQFCIFAAEMKNVFIKYMSMLLVVWYCLSIIGFDVHACTTTGNVFVNSVLGGVTCSDIHPEHDCHGHNSCCCSHGCCDQKKAEDCCTNEIEVLDCDTVVSTDDSSSQVLYCTLVTSQSIYEADLLPMHSRYNILYFPDPGDVIGPDQQAILKIWRI